MIVFFGIAGSGKGTQAEILAKNLNCPVVTTGDILRQNSHNPDVKAATEAGVLVSDDITLPLLEQEFKRIGANGSEFILDGSPRNLRQAQWLVEKIKSGQVKLTALIHIKLPPEEALKRLKQRARHDDTDQTIAERFKFYQDSVMPTLDYLTSQGYGIIEINGNQPIEKVATDIEKALQI